MNKEQQELLDEAYEKYANSHWTPPSDPKGKLLSDQLFSVIPMEHSKETFINECKRNNKFSKKWELKIEERELSLEERTKILVSKSDNKKDFYDRNGRLIVEEHTLVLDEANIPTLLITITYNDKTIESYES
jgi:hypothetical protein